MQGKCIVYNWPSWKLKGKFRFQLILSDINLTVSKLQETRSYKKSFWKTHTWLNLFKVIFTFFFFSILTKSFFAKQKVLNKTHLVMGLKTSCVVFPVNVVTLVIFLEKIIIRCYFSAIIFPSFLHSVFACFLYLLATEKLQIYPLPQTYAHPFIANQKLNKNGSLLQMKEKFDFYVPWNLWPGWSSKKDVLGNS